MVFKVQLCTLNLLLRSHYRVKYECYTDKVRILRSKVKKKKSVRLSAEMSLIKDLIHELILNVMFFFPLFCSLISGHGRSAEVRCS